jgi:hypothetical protein
MRGTCSICGETIRSRRSTKNSAKANFLKAMRKHQWKKHRNTMISRIKAGKQRAQNNPLDTEMIVALQSGAKEALKIYGRMTEKQYQRTSKIMKALKPILPPETVLIWEFLEAVHDEP